MAGTGAPAHVKDTRPTEAGRQASRVLAAAPATGRAIVPARAATLTSSFGPHPLTGPGAVQTKREGKGEVTPAGLCAI